MKNNGVLKTIRKYSPLFNVVLGFGLWCLVRFAFSLIFEDGSLEQAILLSSLYLTFSIIYFFIIKKIGTIQYTGFTVKKIGQSTIFMIPFLAIGIILSIFTVLCTKELGLIFNLEILKENSLGFVAGFFETVFLEEVFIVGFLSALHHRYTRTQWNAVILSLIASLLLATVQIIISGDYDAIQFFFQLFANVVLALAWLKYRNQSIFAINFLALNSYLFLLFALKTSEMYVVLSSPIYSEQIKWTTIIGMIVLIITSIFMILTLKFPIPKKKITYTKEIIDNDETIIEERTVILENKKLDEK